MSTPTEPETETVSAALPWFPGFYDSILDDLMDREIEQEMEETGETYDQIMDRFSSKIAVEAIAKEWVEAFSKETGIPMEFEELVSPREYNFTTDRLFVRIPIDAIEKIAAEMDDKPLRETIRANHSSRSGFVSFYANDLDDPEWQMPVREWDHNQLQTLIEAKLIQEDLECGDFQDDLYEEVSMWCPEDDGWIKDRPEKEAPCAI
jgi:hypothetical protein